MSNVASLLLEHLDELRQKEFDRFKMSLTSIMAPDFKPIPRSKLEQAEQHVVVELMVNQYGPSEAAKITLQILKNMHQKNLAQTLETKLGKVQAGATQGDGASSSSSSAPAPAPAVSLNIQAGGSSAVSAPTLSGGNFSGPVTINMNLNQPS